MSSNKRIQLDVNHMMGDFLGMQYGIHIDAVEALTASAKDAALSVQKQRGKGMLGWMDLPYNQDEVLTKIEACAKYVRDRFDSFVVLGIGGSALGPIAVQQALNHMRWNELPKEKRNGPKLYIEDNVDPERIASLLEVLDIKKTCFNVITKSGATAETMSQYLIIADILQREVGEGWQDHIIATTDAETGNLAKLAKLHQHRMFIIPDGVGGRFSEMSPVGLLAAAVCGIDIRSMLEGAQMMDEACKGSDSIWENPALLEAVLQYVAMNQIGKNIQVVLPYADSLRGIADWFCQLWAESIGKNRTRKDEAVNVGQTPVKALGVTDQHSQLQLYTEGPFDKVITFIKVENYRAITTIPSSGTSGLEDSKEARDLLFLCGKTHNALIEAERQGTEYALYKAGRMSQTIILPEVSAHTIGQLLYFFEMVTAYMGEMLDINAYNQPGVEESKVASYAVLGCEGEKYEMKRKEIAERPMRQGRYVL